MARLTISVPQHLHGRLEEWRDHLNISKVCQEAIEKELRRLEELPDDARALTGLVERLAEEKADGEQRWYAQGVSDGMTWAQGASYVDLKTAAGNEDAITPDLRSAFDTGAARYRDLVDFEDDSYLAGWRFAASEVWRRVRSKI